MKGAKAFQAAVKIGLWSALVLAASSLTHLRRRQFQPSLSSFWGADNQTKDPDLEHDLFSAYHDLFYDHGNSSASGGGESNKSAVVGASNRTIPVISIHSLSSSQRLTTSMMHAHNASTLLKNTTVWMHTETVMEPIFSLSSENISLHLDTRRHSSKNRRERRSWPNDKYHYDVSRGLAPIQEPPRLQRSGSLPSFESPRYEKIMPRVALRRRQSYSEEEGAYGGQQYQKPYKIKVVKVVKTPPPKGLEQVNTQMAEFFSDNFWIPLLGAFFLAGTAVRIGLTGAQTPIIANVTTSVINQAVVMDSSGTSTMVSMNSEETITSSGGTSIVNTDTSSTAISSVSGTTIITRIINSSSVRNRLPPETNIMP